MYKHHIWHKIQLFINNNNNNNNINNNNNCIIIGKATENAKAEFNGVTGPVNVSASIISAYLATDPICSLASGLSLEDFAHLEPGPPLQPVRVQGLSATLAYPLWWTCLPFGLSRPCPQLRPVESPGPIHQQLTLSTQPGSPLGPTIKPSTSLGSPRAPRDLIW